MAWGGIKNLPPGFDVFDGKGGPESIVDRAIRGQVAGLMHSREYLFADLKRNRLHGDYARYFDSCLMCASVLGEIEGGKYNAEVLKDIIEPALATAVEQMESIRRDVQESKAANRKMQYDPQPSIFQMHLKAQPIAQTYPQAAGAKEFDGKFQEISDSVRAMMAP
jgi:hypothetical protein